MTQPQIAEEIHRLKALGWQFDWSKPWTGHHYAKAWRGDVELWSQRNRSAKDAMESVLEGIAQREARMAQLNPQPMKDGELFVALGQFTAEGWRFDFEPLHGGGNRVRAHRQGVEVKADALTAGEAVEKVVRNLQKAQDPPPLTVYLDRHNHCRPTVEVNIIADTPFTPKQADELADSLRAAAEDARQQACSALVVHRKMVEKAHRDLRAVASCERTGCDDPFQMAANAARELETLAAASGSPLPGTGA